MKGASKVKREDRVRILGRWQSVPVAMVRDKAIKPQVRMMAVLLYTFQGNDSHSYPLQRSLAELMDTTERTVQRWVKILIKHQYLTVTRTLYGNLYTLHEPESAFTNTTPVSDAHPIIGSPHPTQGSYGETTPRSDRSMTKNHHDLESPTTPPPTPEGDDGDNADSDQGKQTQTGKMLQDLGIFAWKELQEKLKDVPHAEVERRVYTLIDQGKSQAIIVTSLRNIAFTPGSMSDTGPIPLNKEYWRGQGFSMGGDVDDEDEQQRPRAKTDELENYFRETGF